MTEAEIRAAIGEAVRAGRNLDAIVDGVLAIPDLARALASLPEDPPRPPVTGAWPFGDLVRGGYRVILADPPWAFAAGGDRGANRHYDTMTIDALAALPVGQLAAPHCAIFLWATDPFLDVAINLLGAWGFRFVTRAFEWAKTTARGEFRLGTGFYTRANPETCLLGMTGSAGLPKDRGVRQLIVEPAREHSRKPDRIRDDIERLFDGPYAELFARSTRPGWDCWGNETGKFEVAA